MIISLFKCSKLLLPSCPPDADLADTVSLHISSWCILQTWRLFQQQCWHGSGNFQSTMGDFPHSYCIYWLILFPWATLAMAHQEPPLQAQNYSPSPSRHEVSALIKLQICTTKDMTSLPSKKEETAWYEGWKTYPPVMPRMLLLHDCLCSSLDSFLQKWHEAKVWMRMLDQYIKDWLLAFNPSQIM